MNKINKYKGFTLVEMLVSVSIFSIVMVLSVGAVLLVQDAWRKTSQLRNAVENVNISVESMVNQIRAGHTYDCGRTDPSISPVVDDCPYPNGASTLAFINSDGDAVDYWWNRGGWKRVESNIIEWRSITSLNEVEILSTQFYVDGAEDDSSPGAIDVNNQPKVTITMTGRTQIPRFETRFNLQTTVSQRIVEFQ